MTEKFEIVKNDQDPKLTMINLSGKIDECVDFSGLELTPSKKIVFNFKNVIRINSIGLQKWMQFLSRLPDEINYEFAECPISIINQINMFHGFLGKPLTPVNSFEIPYFCESCNKPETRMVNTSDILNNNQEIEVPNVICSACGESYSFDGVERKYFAFILREKLS